MKSNRGVTAALVVVALTWLVPVGAAHAQTTVSMGRPGDHWASMLEYTFIGVGERNGVYGYKVKLRAEDGCEVELFYPRSTIDFQGKGRTWRNFKVRVKTGWLYYPSRLNASSLPKVHPGVLEVEDHYQRQGDGAIAAAEGFGTVATLGTMTPLPRSVPAPRAPRTTTPRVRSSRTARARTTSAGTRSAATGAGATPASSAAQGALLRAQLAAEKVAGARLPQAISGYTRHGLNQAISRDGVGVSTRAILDAFKNPTSIAGQSGGRFVLTGRDAVVVVNAEGKVITTWATNSAGFRVVP